MMHHIHVGPGVWMKPYFDGKILIISFKILFILLSVKFLSVSKISVYQILLLSCWCTLWFFIVHFDIIITATHLPGVMNTIADHPSHGKLPYASPHQSNPILSPQPTHLPLSISHFVSPQGLDWIFPQFLQLFKKP